MNEVFAWASRAQFDPAEFAWTEFEQKEWFHDLVTTFNVSALTHTATQYYVIFGGFHIVLSPGPTSRVESYQRGLHWQDSRSHVESWLHELRREVDAPDLWATVREERNLGDAASSGLENGLFSSEETTQISRSLVEIKQTLTAMEQFDRRQADLIDNQFAYLDAAANRMGRKDWLHVCYAVLINIGTGLALESENFRALLRSANTALQYIWTNAHNLIK